MRVALACPYGWDAPGGVQVHVRQLAAALRDRGHRVMVLAPSSARPAERYVYGVGRPVRIRYNRSVAPICFSRASARRVRDGLRAFRPEVVHVHEPLVPSTGMLAARASAAPVVATFHAYADRAVLFTLTSPALRRVWRRLDARIAVSEAAATFVSRRFRRDGLRVIPNGADVALFAEAESAPLPEGRRILFVGRLDPRKGFRVMVEAFQRVVKDLPDALLVVAGAGAEGDAVRDLPIEARARVVMLGTVTHHDLPPYHHGCEVFCAPATGRESFGLVLVEAMAAGLPVVASDIPGYREVVRDGVEGILVPPRDPAAVASAVARLLEDRDGAADYGARGRERARAFSWNAIAGRIEEVYAEVAGGARGR